ncbi:MAG: hypothetical protein QOG64_347, partial [Acidimicrobiaceae bacterium]|nr:hypothetical protein [Acidimicrobiaceae bacterium]
MTDAARRWSQAALALSVAALVAAAVALPVRAGADPTAIARVATGKVNQVVVDPTSNRAFALGGTTLKIIDGASNAFTATTLGRSTYSGIAVLPSKAQAYVTDTTNGTVSVYGETGQLVKSITV